MRQGKAFENWHFGRARMPIIGYKIGAKDIKMNDKFGVKVAAFSLVLSPVIWRLERYLQRRNCEK